MGREPPRVMLVLSVRRWGFVWRLSAFWDGRPIFAHWFWSRRAARSFVAAYLARTREAREAEGGRRVVVVCHYD